MERREKSIAQQQSIDNLHKADKLKDEFLANTSHELRTPLNGIIGIAESLRDGALGSVSDAIKKNLSMIAVSGRRLAALVNDILDFSKLKNNDIELSLKSVDIRMVVDTVIEISNILFGSKEIPEVTESVTVSSIRDTQIFENKITENEDQKNVVEVSEMHINEDDKSISILAVDEIN